MCFQCGTALHQFGYPGKQDIPLLCQSSDLFCLLGGVLTAFQLGVQEIHLGFQLIYFGGVLGIQILQIMNNVLPVETVKGAAKILRCGHKLFPFPSFVKKIRFFFAL